MSVWAPVVAALGASALTGVVGLGTISLQESRKGKAADLDRRGSAYVQLITRSLSFSTRAATLRNAMQVRSGVSEGVDVTLGFRRPMDPLELHDWFAQGFEPINEAWSTIQMIGSPEAVDSATELLDACGDLLALATQPGQARSKVMTTIAGMRWTPEQDKAYQDALRRLVKEREALITIARAELGRTEIWLPNSADRPTGAGATSAGGLVSSGGPAGSSTPPVPTPRPADRRSKSARGGFPVVSLEFVADALRRPRAHLLRATGPLVVTGHQRVKRARSERKRR